jgi:TolA-binding protein
MSSRTWFWLAALVLLTSGPVLAQSAPVSAPTGVPSPLDLVRGIREHGMPDLALEYLREIENRPMPDDDRKAMLLERARCLLDAADDEPDEGTRTSMIGEAKEAFNEFLTKNPSHPRASEAALAVARLTSIEAKAQLNRARRMEVPPPLPADAPAPERLERERERDVAIAKQRDEAKKAQPLFLLASKRFHDAAEQMRAKLADKTLDPMTRQSLTREAFDAELASGINQYNLAETVLTANTSATLERNKYLEEARGVFAKLAKGSPTSRTAWVARAWMAEVLMDQSKPTEADAEFKAILGSNLSEAEDGKRLVRFFQLRRAYLAAIQERSTGKLGDVARDLQGWLARYGNTRKPTAEVIAARYYRAFALQFQAELLIGPPPKDGKPQTIGATPRGYLVEAEKTYRALSQTDNDYTIRATRNRMFIVRKLIGEADKPAADYATFESAQMAALIQIAKLQDAERADDVLEPRRDAYVRAGRALAAAGTELQRLRAAAEIPERKLRVLALLERARELATPQDNPTDVIDNLLRLVYFYQNSEQHYQAAVLGEHIARTVRTTGGKSAVAGLMALNGYITAAARVKVRAADPSQAAAAAEAEEALRRIDRERAVELARFLDKTYPNDPATDAARHRLAILFVQEKKFDEAFEVVTKIRGGYAQLTNARQLEGYIASVLVTTRDIALPPGGKAGVFRRATADLSRVVKPPPNASEEEVRGYLSVRARLAQLYLAQSRADEEAEKATPGYDRAIAVADELLAAVPTFDSLTVNPVADKLNLDGLEMRLLGRDVRTRALFLRGRAHVDGGPEKMPAAAAVIQPVIDDVAKTGSLMTPKMVEWLGGQGDAGDPPFVAAQKAKIAGLTAGVDKTRRDIVMLGFKLCVRQGKPADAAAMLDRLKKAGGSVADNQSTYELMARELAAPIPGLRKEKKDVEAKALGDGVALLLKELSAIPNLTPSSVLFIGQTLHTVGQNDDALKEFAKIPAPAVPKVEGVPADAQWWQVDAKTIQDGQARTKFQTEVRDYRFAQLYTAKALHGAKRLDEAEKLLTGVIGTSDKQGWGYASYDFRRELASVYETKGAGTADVKAAGVEWGKANKEWTTLFQFAVARVKNLPENADPAQVRQAKSAFFDAFYEIQRLLVVANTQLLAGNPKLNDRLAEVGKRIADMEITNKIAELEKEGPAKSIITAEVWNRYYELLDKNPTVKNAYKAAGGKLFLERAKE